MFFGAGFKERAFSQIPGEITSTNQIKSLSLEDLMNLEVTSVSKVSEKLSEVASAIQVITQDDIRRSAATSVPEALRLSSNLQVTQLNARHWIISARGFNSAFANKLLVMIDGRTVYSPLFAGVFWDAQNVLIDDVDRIEVISGPGGALWGANAVNGVINIITKSTKDTQGLLASVSAGTSLRNIFEARYGGTIGTKLSYRVYGMHQDRDHTLLADGQDNADKSRLTQGGFAMDWDHSANNKVAVQGNFYEGKQFTEPDASTIDGQNVMAKWSHTFSEKSELVLQTYADRTWRHDVVGTIDDQLVTYDIDLQHGFALGRNNSVLYGAGYRFMDDHTENSTPYVGMVPANRKMHLFSSFIQDEIAVIPERLKLTVGAKLEHNTFSGFEFQPSARFAVTPFKHHVFWGAISRAVRAPSRIDVDYRIPVYTVPPTSPSVAGGPNFTSEKLVAYELGYRVQPSSNVSLSLALFNNRYDDLYSVEALPGTLTYQIQNGAEGRTHGLELSGNYMVTTHWRLRGGYTYFYKDLNNKPGNVTDPAALGNLGSDAKNQIVLQSILNLPKNFQLDIVSRYVDRLPETQFNPAVESYLNLDARLGWQYKDRLTLSVNGQNLLEKQNSEIGSIQIRRGVYGQLTWRY